VEIGFNSFDGISLFPAARQVLKPSEWAVEIGAAVEKLQLLPASPP
jgi:hypothetical protein